MDAAFLRRRKKVSAETEEALKKYAIRFDSVVNSYYSGGLGGNGRLGACIYKGKGDPLLSDRSLQLTVNRGETVRILSKNRSAGE